MNRSAQATFGNIFHRFGDQNDTKMSFEAEMILSKQGLDDLGQPVEASITLVRYVLRLGWRGHEAPHSDAGPLEVLEETLVPLRLGDAEDHILFPASKEWRDSVLEGRRTSKFISTDESEGQRLVRVHQDGRSGRLLTRPASGIAAHHVEHGSNRRVSHGAHGSPGDAIVAIITIGSFRITLSG